MSNYRIGDKLVLKITGAGERMSVTNLNICIPNEELDKLERLDSDYVNENYGMLQDEAYEQGLEDAWELAGKIVQRNNDENAVIFAGYEYLEDIFDNFTPQEALKKLKAYKETQCIKVGDVLKSTYSGLEYWVVTEEDDEVYDYGVIDLQNKRFDRISTEEYDFVKTGKHIDIQSICEQIGGE